MLHQRNSDILKLFYLIKKQINKKNKSKNWIVMVQSKKLRKFKFFII